jgi:hypothetical protein
MRDPGVDLLGHLLETSHDLAPDEIVAAVARAGQAVDADDVAVYLVDYEQVLLVPLPDGTDRAPLEIGTRWPAGPLPRSRCRRLTSDRAGGGGCRCWTARNARVSSASPSQESMMGCGCDAPGWPP